MRRRLVAAARSSLLALLLAACGASRPAQVVSVASHDLGCDRVDISEVAEDRYAAYGCGRGAVYARVCDGDNCRWGRLRHGHEESVAAGTRPAPPEPREVLPAPLPEQRQVLPAPSPQREVMPAPAPGSAAPAPSDAAGAQGATGPGTEPQDSALQAGAASADASTLVPLSQGDLSDPYQAQVPAQPIAQQVAYPPPAPLVETRPFPPARSYVWIGGYWWWGPSNWVWVPGYWGAPYYGYSYVPGCWYWGAGYWRYAPGGWAHHGTTVVVHHGLPPRPSTTATVRAFTPHRVAPRGAYVGGVHRAVQAPGSFRPHSSPLYPYGNKGSVRVAPSGGGYVVGGSSHYRAPTRYGSSGVGRVVAPNTTVRPPASFGNSSGSRAYGSSGAGYRASPNSAGARSYSGGGGRSYSGGGGGRSYGGGGGGRSSGGGGGGGRSYGGGGGGGGHGGGSVHVSPGGGGRR